MPRRRKHYRLSASTGRVTGCFYWILILVLVGGIYWVWKQTRRATPARPPAQQVTQRPAAPPTPPLPPRPSASTNGVVSAPVRSTALPRPPQDTLEAQIALARQAICPGALDGVMGFQTRAALLVFQKREKLPLTGALDDITRNRLRIET